MKTIEGKLNASGRRFTIVAGRFNDFISTRLLDGAMDCLKRHHVAEEDVTVIWVPGSFEIPLAAKQVCAKGDVDAVICLGAVIRGETPISTTWPPRSPRVSPASPWTTTSR